VDFDHLNNCGFGTPTPVHMTSYIQCDRDHVQSQDSTACRDEGFSVRIVIRFALFVYVWQLCVGCEGYWGLHWCNTFITSKKDYTVRKHEGMLSVYS
jgi:hypothetical protein